MRNCIATAVVVLGLSAVSPGDTPAVATLIATLKRSPHLSVRTKTVQTLRKRTGRDFGQDADFWSAWWAWRQQVGPAKPRGPAAWANVKTIRLVVTETYVDAAKKKLKIKLPLRDWVGTIVALWGLKCVADHDRPDATLRLTVHGNNGHARLQEPRPMYGPMARVYRPRYTYRQVQQLELRMTGVFEGGKAAGFFAAKLTSPAPPLRIRRPALPFPRPVDIGPRPRAPQEAGISTLAAALKRMPRDPVFVELHRLLGNAQPLIAALGHGDKALRTGAAKAMTKIDPQWRQTEAARRAVGRFVAVLRQAKLTQRQVAAWALRQIGAAAVGELVGLLTAKDAAVRARAAVVLGEIGEADKSVVAALTRALADRSTWVRGCAAEALGKLGPPAAAAVEALTRALEDEETPVRHHAAVALAIVDPKSVPKAAAVLTHLLDHDAAAVRHTAAEALRRVRSRAASRK